MPLLSQQGGGCLPPLKWYRRSCLHAHATQWEDAQIKPEVIQTSRPKNHNTGTQEAWESKVTQPSKRSDERGDLWNTKIPKWCRPWRLTTFPWKTTHPRVFEQLQMVLKNLLKRTQSWVVREGEVDLGRVGGWIWWIHVVQNFQWTSSNLKATEDNKMPGKAATEKQTSATGVRKISNMDEKANNVEENSAREVRFWKKCWGWQSSTHQMETQWRVSLIN